MKQQILNQVLTLWCWMRGIWGKRVMVTYLSCLLGLMKGSHDSTFGQPLSKSESKGSIYCQCVGPNESHVWKERHMFKHQRVLPCMEFWQLLHCCKMRCSQLIHKWRATSNIRYMLTQARAYYFTIKMSRKSSCSYDWLCFSYVGSRKSSNFD